MAVTYDEVVWAYRALLGRNPENQDVILQQMNAANFAVLRNDFLNSLEFRKNYPILQVGRYRGIDEIEVQTTCSLTELEQMAENIAREWRHFGETEPHWSVVTGDEFKPASIAENMDAFYELGKIDISYIVSALKRNNVWKDDGVTALDFGCGVGRLTLSLAPFVSHITGVDISSAHLVHAEKRAGQAGIGNVTFQPISTIQDIDFLPKFDLIISLIVLQHNPPPVMVELLKKLLSRLNPGGTAVIQMPTYIVGQRFTVADYLSNQQPSMEMNAIPQRVIYEVINQSECNVIEVREDGYMGSDIGLSHTFFVQKRVDG